MQSKLERKLTRYERQAYEGAKDFYHMMIPFVIILTLGASINRSYSRSTDKEQIVKDSLPETIIEGIIAIVSYAIALKYYKSCNFIDTTPVLPIEKSLESLDKPFIEQQSDRLLGSHKPKKFYCDICKITCDYRTRHCRKCGVCIERYDHHCFWIGNCVGRHNHKQFYLFLAAQTINNIAVFLLIYRLETFEGWQWWVKWGGKLLSFGFCCFTGYLLLYHSMLVSCGITTWQHMRKTKISYIKYLPAGFNPFSRGIIQNWKFFFTEVTKASGSEQVQSWQDQIVPFEEIKNIEPSCNIIQNQYYSCC